MTLTLTRGRANPKSALGCEVILAALREEHFVKRGCSLAHGGLR
jgi:hypothetical protein